MNVRNPKEIGRKTVLRRKDTVEKLIIQKETEEKDQKTNQEKNEEDQKEV